MNERPTYPYHCAFPCTDAALEEGLTKREYFAAMALQGFLSASAGREWACAAAVEAADALIAALNKEPKAHEH